MEKTPISKIHVFTHPDYEASRKPFIPFSSRQKELIEDWDKFVFNNIRQDSNALLIYYSAFRHPEPTTRFAEVNRAVLRDRNRIIDYSQSLENRFLVFPYDEMPPAETLLRQFERRDLTYAPEETQLFAFGEYRRICVEAWKEHTLRELGIPEENTSVIEGLSLEHYSPVYGKTYVPEDQKTKISEMVSFA